MKKNPWWMSLEIKELTRSANIMIGSANCGFSLKFHYFVCAAIWAGWAFMSGIYLIGVYIEEHSKRQLERAR